MFSRVMVDSRNRQFTAALYGQSIFVRPHLLGVVKRRSRGDVKVRPYTKTTQHASNESLLRDL